MKRSRLLLIPVCIALLIIGCSYVATNNAFFAETSQQVYNGNYPAAIAAIEGAKEDVYQLKDRVLYYLDLGMIYHYNGDYQLSNKFLTEAEYAIDELYTKSVSKAALSLLLNDNTLDYGGEDYEDIYINIFKALNYINLGDKDGAFVEVRRVNEKLAFLEDKYANLSRSMSNSKDAKIAIKAGKNQFYNSALARYISMLLYRSKERWDDVRIDNLKLDQAWKTQPDIYNFAQPDLRRSLDKTAAARLNLFCFAGKSPEKRSRTWWIRTFEDHLFIGESKESLMGDKVSHYMDMIYWKDIEENLFFKFEIPLLKSQPSRIDHIEIYVDGKKAAPQLMENIDNVAAATFEMKRNMIYLKTIIRTVTKGLLAKQGKDKIDENVQSEFLATILNFSADLAVSASEQADLRISRYFPQKAYTAEFHLQPGEHDVEIRYVDKYGNTILSDQKGLINIKADQLNLLESFCLQ